jgi:hypothetical protein
MIRMANLRKIRDKTKNDFIGLEKVQGAIL